MRTAHHLLLIDPQNDFCDLPASACPVGLAPQLPVPGAHADMQRLARWITAHHAQLDRITVTLDSHQLFDIAHPALWQHGDGRPVAPFTPITAAQVRAGDLTPRHAAYRAACLAYVEALEARGRYTLMVWPAHCLVGSWGHGIHAEVLAACNDWQVQRQRALLHVCKGSDPWTEHYSALEAEVPRADAPHTHLNRALLNDLLQAEQLWVAGEASSHCVRATIEHLLAHAPAGFAKRLHLLMDAMSPVTGFADAAQAFFERLRAAGAVLTTTDRALLR